MSSKKKQHSFKIIISLIIIICFIKSTVSLNELPADLCRQLDPSFFVPIVNGNFEFEIDGWQDAKGMLFIYSPNAIIKDSYEGLGSAIFSKSRSKLSSNLIQFPNYTKPNPVTEVFKTVTFQLNFKMVVNSTGPDDFSCATGFLSGTTGSDSLVSGDGTGVSSGSHHDSSESFFEYSKLDLKNIENNRENTQRLGTCNSYENSGSGGSGSDNLEPDYLEILIDNISLKNISLKEFPITDTFQTLELNIDQFLDGNNHTIYMKYHNTGYFRNSNQNLIFFIDLFDFIPIPYEYITGDIYISNNGDDIIGNGTVGNSFCSIQRAIFSMIGGNNIYLMDEQVPVRMMYKEQRYLINSNGKDFQLIANNPGYTELFGYETTLDLLLCKGSKCTFNGIIINQNQTFNMFIISQGSDITFENVEIYNNQTVIPRIQSTLLAPVYTNITMNDCFMYNCYSSCFQTNSEYIQIENTTFDYCNTFILASSSEGKSNIFFKNITVDNSIITGNGQLVYTFGFNSIILDSMLVIDSDAEQVRYGLQADGGNFVGLYNFQIADSSISFQFSSIKEFVIDQMRISSYQFGVQPFLHLNFVENISIEGIEIEFGFPTETPFIIVNSSQTFYINDLKFRSNPAPFINLHHIKDFSLSNAHIQNNLRQTLFLATESIMSFTNVTMDTSPNQFIIVSNSSLYLNNITLCDNQNLNSNILEPMIYLSNMKTVVVNQLFSNNNLNFELMKMVQCPNVTIQNSIVDGSLLGNILVISDSTRLTINNSTFINSFLATDYPIHLSGNSKLFVSNSIFFNNTQYFYLENSEFHFVNCIFSNVITVNHQSYFISFSKGTFKNVSIGETNPHLGLSISDSTVDHYGCKFVNISSNENTVGLYVNSKVLFQNCLFKDNAAAANMMTFQYGTTVFNGCIFDSLSSLDNSILTSSSQDLLVFNNSIIQNCQTNGNGIYANYTNALFENSIVQNNFYLRGNLFSMQMSNISFCNITHINNEANYYMLDGNFKVELFYAYKNYFPFPLFDLLYTNLELTTSNISENTGASIFLADISNVSLSDSTFHNNEFFTSFLSSDNSTISITTSSFSGNVTPKNGTCISSILSNVTMTYSNFTGNTATSGGVGVLDSQSKMIIDNCLFADNTALYDGFDDGQNGCGGCFYISDYLSQIDISNSTFFNNNATYRGGVFFLFNSVEHGCINPNYDSSDYNSSDSNSSQDNSSHGCYGDSSEIAPLEELVKNSIQVNIASCSFISNSADFGPGGVCFSNYNAGCKNDSITSYSGNSATYGYEFASTVQTFEILPLQDGAHPLTQFTAAVSLYDFYNQSMMFLDFIANYTLNVYAPNNMTLNGNLTYSPALSEYQGYLEYLITLPETCEINQEFVIVATAETVIYKNYGKMESQDVTFQSSLYFTLSQCSIGYQFGEYKNCTPCQIGYYGYNGIDCAKCDMNQTICPGKSSIYAQAGYWVLLEDLQPPQVYPCDPAYCLSRQCREGQNGTLCSVCEPGYSKVKMFCQKCNGLNWFILSGIVVFCLLYIFIMSAFSIPSASVILNYLLVVQTIAVIGYNIQYLTILPLFGFDIDYIPETCLDPSITYLWKQVISLGLIFFVISPISMHVSWSRDLSIKLFPHLKVFVTEFFDKSLFYSVVSYAIIFYTPISYISISLVSCIKIGSNLYLSQDPSVQCFTKKHIPLFILACILLIVVTLGVPLFIFIQIRKRKRYFLKIFFEKYRPKFIWWDIVLMIRSILYILVTLVFAFSYMYIKGLVISTMGLFFCFITWMCQPYKSQYKNELETYLSLILCLSGLMINTRSFDSTDILSGVILSLSGVAALIPIGICIRHIISKIFPMGLHTTNPPTTKIKQPPKKDPNASNKIPNENSEQTDSLLLIN